MKLNKTKFLISLLFLVSCSIMGLPLVSYATSGYLQKASIKTCPDGNTYGKHGSGHWHLAQKISDDKWSAVGGEIASDPCPSSDQKPTSQPSNTSTQQQSSGASSTPTQQPTDTKQETTVQKSANVDISKILVNGTSVGGISGNMTYSLADDTINEIEVELSDSKATYTLSEYKKDFTDRNSIAKVTITVKAEDSTTKAYSLKIVKKPADLLLRVWLGSDQEPIKFDNDNTYTTNVLAYQSKICMNTKLSTDKAKVLARQDGEDVNGCVDLQMGDNTIIFQVTDQYGSVYEYKVIVQRMSVIITILTLVISWILLCATLALCGIALRAIIHRVRNKKKILPLFKKNDFTKGRIRSLVVKVYVPLVALYLNAKKKQKSSARLKFWLVAWIMILVVMLGGIFGANNDTGNITRKDGNPSATITYEPAKEQAVEEMKPAEEVQPAQLIQQLQASGDPMSGIVIAEAADVVYTRNDYEPSWSVGSGCDIRARILQSTSTVAYKTGKNGCTVTYGSWVDPYTGKTLTGNPYRGDGTENDLDIDHIIPLKYVNAHGGSNWAASTKRAYGASLAAMDNGVYVAVSASENRSKSDKGPSAYYPPNPDYKCTYAQKWRDIARVYSISVSKADYDVLKNVLIACNIQ